MARHSANQLHAFVTLPESGIWITFENGHLWWMQAAGGVETVEAEGRSDPDSGADQHSAHGYLRRRTVGGWRNTSLTGKLLTISGLSTRLTRVAG